MKIHSLLWILFKQFDESYSSEFSYPALLLFMEKLKGKDLLEKKLTVLIKVLKRKWAADY